MHIISPKGRIGGLQRDHWVFESNSHPILVGNKPWSQELGSTLLTLFFPWLQRFTMMLARIFSLFIYCAISSRKIYFNIYQVDQAKIWIGYAIVRNINPELCHCAFLPAGVGNLRSSGRILPSNENHMTRKPMANFENFVANKYSWVAGQMQLRVTKKKSWYLQKYFNENNHVKKELGINF